MIRTEFKNNLLWRLVGLVLLAIPFIPLLSIYGELRGYDFPFTPLQWLSAILITLVAAWVICSIFPLETLVTRLSRFTEKHHRAVVAVTLILLAVVLIFVQITVFRFHPLLVDSVVQLFQAQIFASGALVAPPPKLFGFFMTQHMVLTDSAWASQYPPGHSALLALGILVRAPWIVGPLLSVASGYMIYQIAASLYDRKTALLTLLLTLASPFYFFMGASFMNHVSTLFFITLFVACYLRWEESRRSSDLFLAGAALGLAFLSRPFTALAVGVPFLCFSLPYLWQSRRFAMYLTGLGGFILIASINFWINAVVTGDPFLPGYVKLWGPGHGVGFHTSPWGDAHTVGTGLRNQLINISLLNEYLFESPLPGLMAIAILLIFARKFSLWDLRLTISFLVLPAAYFFYWHRDSYLGPRFLYEGLVFILPLTARGIIVGLGALKDTHFQIPKLFKPVSLANFFGVVLLLSLLYTLSFGLPQRFRVYSTSLESFKRDLTALARAQGITEGVVFIPVSWGNRIISNLRELGVSASLTQQSYKFIDHCLLDQLWKTARRAGMPVATLNAELEQLIAKRMTLQQMKLNDDPTLKLRPAIPLSAECIDEIEYDAAGYTLFTPHLPENRPDLAGKLVFATDLRARNSELASLYPGKRRYILRGDNLLELKL